MRQIVLQSLKIRQRLYFKARVCYNKYMNYKNNIVFLIFFISSFVWAQSNSSRTSSKRPWLLSNKSEAEAAHRFSLAEWLDTKNRNNAMDMWLGYNTNPADAYEFKLSLNRQQDDVSTKVGGGVPVTRGTFRSYEGEFSAYAKNVGLTAGYHDNNEESFTDSTGMFNFRLFGKSMQTSHLTLHYGLRTRLGSNNAYRLNQQFPAATLQLYIVENFGIYSHYRMYLKSNEAVFGDTEGNELQYGVYIEYGRLRIFGNMFEENQNSILNNVNTDINHKGTKFGIQLYF
jgi:hypothetical protein